MSRTLAIIEDGIVTNVILADSWPNGIDITDLTPRPGPGWSYDGVTFVAPPVVTPPVATTSYMSHFGFLSRFTPQQRLAIRERTNAASPNYDPTLDDAMFLFNQAETINVDLQTTKQLVGYLAMTGLIQASDVDRLLAPIDSSSPHARFS